MTLPTNVKELRALAETASVPELFAVLLELSRRGEAWLDSISVHSHRCPIEACGFVWTHDQAKLPDDEDGYDWHHTCPQCGKGKSRKKLYLEDAPAAPHISHVPNGTPKEEKTV